MRIPSYCLRDSLLNPTREVPVNLFNKFNCHGKLQVNLEVGEKSGLALSLEQLPANGTKEPEQRQAPGASATSRSCGPRSVL
jgi:hypothetical protein